MIVYVDVALIISFMVNGLLLWIPGKIAGVQCKKCRLVCGAFFSVLYAAVCYFADFFSVPVSLVTAYIQIRIVYDRKTAVLYGVYLLMGFTLSGWQQAFSTTGVVALLLFVCGVLLSIKVAKLVFKFVRTQNLRRNIHIQMGNVSLEFEGYIDSGNRLSVAVLNKEIAEHLLGEKAVSDMQNLLETTVEYAVRTCTTVSGSGMIPVFKPDLFTVNGRQSKLLVGINFMPMHEKMLLPQNELEVF